MVGPSGVVADIAIENDRITTIGSVSGATKRTLTRQDGVSPGFIDVHSHDDFALLDRPLCDFKIMQGVTTEVIGNCGFGAAPAGAAYKAYIRSFGAQLFGPSGNFSWETTEEFFHTLEMSPASLNIALSYPRCCTLLRPALKNGSPKRKS